MMNSEEKKTGTSPAPEEMNLTKRVATFGIASRRKSADLIREGHVSVNGKVETNPGTRVTPADRVTVNGTACNAAPEKIYVMLNKPRGYVCTCSDPHAKKKAVDLIHLKNGERLFSVGRLDKDSEGLILFTNDGVFADRIEHPRNGITKTYAVSLDHPFTEDQLQQMCDGVLSEGETLSAVEVYSSGPRKIDVLLQEGKKREVRRMVTALGNETRRLERIAIGGLKRGMLKCGEWRFMTLRDIARIFGVREDDPSLSDYPVRSKTVQKTPAGSGRKNFHQWGGTPYGRKKNSKEKH